MRTKRKRDKTNIYAMKEENKKKKNSKHDESD